MEKYILASASPRRKQLFSMISGDYAVMPTDIDEEPFRELAPKKQAVECSRAKARACAAAVSSADGGESIPVIVGCDTVVAFGDMALGKPRDETEAAEFLKMLSGKSHFVYTAVTLIKGNREKTFCEKTAVEFYPISDSEIEAYCITEEPYDKAGGYGIQGRAALWVKAIRGCYYNVMGLPVARLNKMLTQWGL